MRVLDYFWMLWRSSWTRNSEFSALTSHLCHIYNTSLCSCDHHILFTFLPLGKRVLINGTSINLSNAWRPSWTIRLVQVDKEDLLLHYLIWCQYICKVNTSGIQNYTKFLYNFFYVSFEFTNMQKGNGFYLFNTNHKPVILGILEISNCSSGGWDSKNDFNLDADKPGTMGQKSEANFTIPCTQSQIF